MYVFERAFRYGGGAVMYLVTSEHPLLETVVACRNLSSCLVSTRVLLGDIFL